MLLQSHEGLAVDGYEMFVNIRDPLHTLALSEEPPSDNGSLPADVSILRIDVLRDYGLTDRGEAPHP